MIGRKKIRQEAISACNFRGHSMKLFVWTSKTTAYSECRHCKKQVAINRKPLPNEIDIAGEAVALSCKD